MIAQQEWPERAIRIAEELEHRVMTERDGSLWCGLCNTDCGADGRGHANSCVLFNDADAEGLTSGEGLRALSDRATAGPWAWEQCGDKEDAPVVGIAFPGDDPDCKAPYEGEFRDSDASRMTIAYDWQWCDGNSPSANAAFAVACVNYVRAMLAASPKAAATASVREDCAAACDRIATGSVYIGESEEGRARHEGIIAGARNCAAAIRRLTDSGTAATIGGERA